MSAKKKAAKPKASRPRAPKAPKIAAELPAPMPALIPQPHGGALLSGGVPGHDGSNAGRPPNWLKAFCDDLLAEEANKAQVRAILGNKDHPAYATMWKAVADRAAGKAPQAVELTGKDGGAIEIRQAVIIGGVKIEF